MGPNMNPLQMILNQIQNSPQIANSPQARELIQILQSGDVARGEQMAMNICNSYGVTKEDGYSQARNFFARQFNIPF